MINRLKQKIFILLHWDLAHHYQQCYSRYLKASISDDSFEMGAVMECEYLLSEYFHFDKDIMKILQSEVKCYHEGGKVKL